MKKYKKNIDEFKKNGFTIFQNYFKDSQVEELGKMIVQGYNKSLDSKINHKNISRLICKYESEKKYDELYNSFKLINSSDTFKKIGKNLNDFYQNISSKKTRVINNGFAIGIKNSKRTAYEWHQEKPYYKNTQTLHFQFPILYPCSKENGTMSVLECSHKLGYISDVNNIKLHKKSINSYIPKKIDSYLNDFSERHFVMSLNDLSMFHENIIHRSNKNNSDLVRFAGIVRLEILQ